jgi:hypothetical protein
MLKFILTLVTIYFLFKIFRRFIFVSVFRAFEKRTREDFEKFNGNSPGKKKEEGKITITIPKPGKGKSKQTGSDSQYTDYEEIK